MTEVSVDRACSKEEIRQFPWQQMEVDGGGGGEGKKGGRLR